MNSHRVTEFTVEWTDEHGDVPDEEAWKTDMEARQSIKHGNGDYIGRLFKDVIQGFDLDGTGMPTDWVLVSREELGAKP